MTNPMVTKNDWIEQVLDNYNRTFHMLKYGSMCKHTLGSNKRIAALQRGIGSMKQLYELFNTYKVDSYWMNLVKIHLINTNIAYQYICNNNNL